MRDIVISLGRGRNLADITKTVKSSWQKFAEFITREPPVTEDKASVGWYCGAQFDPEYRDSKNFVARHILTFDYDEIDEWDVEEIKATYKDLAHVMYTTASHKPDAPRIRVLFPLTRPATIDEFCCVTRTIAARFDIEKLARESDTPAQMMFLPSKKKDGIFWAEVNEGAWVDVDAVLGEYDDWTEKSNWPRRLQGDSVHATDDVPAPDTKVGVVGDFCRAFRIPDAIDRFDLPYVRGSEGRWTFTRGSRPDGLRLYDDDLKAHSEHNTDPAHGQNNAFDLVRLHKFGELDSEEDLAKPVTLRPSYKAMCKLALEQPELQAARTQSEFTNLDADADEHGSGFGSDTDTSAGEGQATNQTSNENQSDKKNASPALNPFKVIPAPEFATTTPLEWYIKGVLPQAELAVIYGESGSGKSFLALDLVAAISRGATWRDRTTRNGRAVYVCAEGASGFRQRLRAYAHAHDVDLAILPGVIGNAPNMLDEKETAQITKAVCEWGETDVVVIDTLAAAMPGGDENTGKDLGKVVDHCKFLHRKTGALIVLIHHSGKDASKGARGWSGLRAAADAEIEITRSGDFRTMSITKQKDGSDGDRWAFKLKVVVLGMDEDGDEITSCVIEHVDAEIPRDKRPEPQGMYAKNVMKIARSELRTGVPMEMSKLVELAAEELPKAEEGKRDTRKQSTARAIQKLVVDGHLFLHENNSVSLTSAEPATDEDWMDE